MTMTLNLPQDLEERLQRESERRGVPVATLTLELLDHHLPARDSRQNVIDLLQSWLDEEDAQEQRETGEYLIRTLDEDRLSSRKLFPPELKGVTW
jgi:predicted DNA-binding protein